MDNLASVAFGGSMKTRKFNTSRKVFVEVDVRRRLLFLAVSVSGSLLWMLDGGLWG